MEYAGVKIDTAKLKIIESEIDNELKAISKSLSKYTGSGFNINSQKDLNRLIFDELNLETATTKGKNGLRSLSSNILKKLLPQHEAIKLIMDYKSLFKVKSTFIKALKKINRKTGRLHTSINQTVTTTGRFSSSNPNLQNIPSRTIGKRLRECFVASSENHTLIGADYSNIELRVMAIISKDKEMLEAYKDGTDLHTLTASKVLNIDYENVDKDQRNIAKAINFGLIYGMTAQGLSQSLSQSTDKDFSVEECQSFINKYFELYEGVSKCRDELIYKATIKGFAQTLFGRKRSLLNINSNDSYKRESAKRFALNTPIQGTAADIIKMAMVNIDNRIKKEGVKSKMILQVHDELLFEVPNSELKYMKKLVKYEMENAIKLPIALEIDHSTIKNHFKLRNISLPNGQKLHGDNIDIYHKNNSVYISTSIPYLIYGHNYTEVDINDLYILFKCLSEVISIDIFNGRVIDFEVAILYNSSLEFKNLIKTISSVSGLELQKKTTSFIAYGKGNTQLKIYNIYRNLKSKVSKSVFNSINGLRTNCLKIELKLIKDKRYTVEQLLEFGISENLEVLNDLIENKINYSECDYDGTKFDDILYRALLKTNKYTYKNADETILDIIDTLPISYSQKTARRKSLREKQLKTKLAGKTNFKDLLTLGRCDDLPF